MNRLTIFSLSTLLALLVLQSDLHAQRNPRDTAKLGKGGSS